MRNWKEPLESPSLGIFKKWLNTFSWGHRNGWNSKTIVCFLDYFFQRRQSIRVMDTLSSKQNVITLAWLLCGICPWLLKSSNGTFLDDPNEISSWDTQGQRFRFWRTTLNTHTYIHSKAECRNTVSQLFWLFFLTLQRLIFRKMEE